MLVQLGNGLKLIGLPNQYIADAFFGDLVE